MITLLIELSYIVASVLFILGLKMLGSPATARKGNRLSAIGMLIAIVITLLHQDIIDYKWIATGLLIGTVVGVYAARVVQMTQMPEMVALLNGFGGIASLFVAWGVYHYQPDIGGFEASTIFLSILIGGVTFSGSLIAWAKLSEKCPGRPILFPGQNVFNLLLMIGTLVAGVFFSLNAVASYPLFIFVVIAALILGILAVIPIGGADMPVVISLLNSYSGMAACTTGFVIKNNVLIVSGALVGASGIILTQIMCKAMNRSLANVLFSGFGAASSSKKKTSFTGEAKPVSAQDAYYLLDSARSVVFVPGYGMAVAQAQHIVRELGSLLEKNGCEVKYAIHPVAGRMPGHMNVLLAEANVPYDQLVEMDDINSQIDTVDICLVIGANDVVNPAALTDKTSAIYGMPIIEVHRAKTVIIMKRSLATGFAGVDNPLFFNDNSRMLFGDAKATLANLVAEFKD